MSGLIKASLLSITCFAGIVFLLSGPRTAAQEKNNNKNPPANAADYSAEAKAAFKATCARCHGEDGRGDTVLGEIMTPPNFTDAKWWKDVTDERLIDSITNGKDEMPAFGKKLTKHEIA